jgi:hypothetical protein
MNELRIVAFMVIAQGTDHKRLKRSYLSQIRTKNLLKKRSIY